MLLERLGLVLLATTGTQALWLAACDVTLFNNSNGGGQFPSPFCQVGKGDTREQAWSACNSLTHGVALSDVRVCSAMPNSKGHQLGGFWNDHGTINYEDSNRHWYCKPSGFQTGQAICDGGSGAPR